MDDACGQILHVDFQREIPVLLLGFPPGKIFGSLQVAPVLVHIPLQFLYRPSGLFYKEAEFLSMSLFIPTIIHNFPFSKYSFFSNIRPLDKSVCRMLCVLQSIAKDFIILPLISLRELRLKLITLLAQNDKDG